MTGLRIPILVAAALWAAGLSAGALALTCQSNANGNWNAAGTWTGCGGGTPGAGDDVQIANANTVTIPAGVAALANSVTFTVSNGTANLTHAAASSTLTVGAGGVTINSPGNNNSKNWNINAGTATVNGPLNMNGGGNNSRIATIVITTGSLDVNGTVTMTAAGAARTVINMSGGAGSLLIAGSLSLASGNGTLTPGTTSTVTYDSATTPVTVATGSAITYNHLVIAKGAGNVANAAATGALTVGGNLTVTSGTFDIPAITAAVTGTTGVSGTIGLTSATGTKTFSGAVTVNGTWSNSGNANVTLGAGLTNSGTFTAGNGTHTLTGNLTNSATFNAGAGTFSLTGGFPNNGTFSASTGTFNFNGGAAQTITGTASGTTIFANLALNNANGLSLTGTHNVTVSTLLTLATGAITTGANVLYISNGSNIASAGGSDFVIGNLRKSVPAAANTRIFEIGIGSNYLPVTLTFASVGTGGDLTVTTTAGEHPNIATSGIDNTLMANRYWTLVGTTIASVTYNATFTWIAADLDGGADTSIFEMSRYSPPAPAAGTWNSTTTGARTATSIEITGNTGFGDFAAGQPLAAAAGIGRFNAYDTTTAAGAVTGFITTKVAGASFSVDVIALRNNRKSIDTGYKGTVVVELLNASDNSGALDASTACNSSWVLIQSLPSLVFDGSESGRKSAAVTENNAWREVRFRMSDGALIGCSTDAFAIRPAGFSVSVTDTTWTTTGTARTLNNATATGGNVHKAGHPFTITATAAPASATNYNGDPTVATGGLACTLPGTCTSGTLTLGAFSGGGARVSNTADYSEAGAFNLTLEDRLFAVIDAADGTPADCSAAGRFVCQSNAPLPVGRFVPDRFAVTAVTQPIFLTFDANDASCTVPPSGPRRSFSYIGQAFGYQTPPVAMITAQNSAGGTTTNYRGTLWKLASASLSQAFANSPAEALGTSQILAPVVTETPDTGSGTASANAGDKLSFVRDSSAARAPFNANLSLTWSVSDASEAGANQGTIATSAPLVFDGGGGGIAFDSGSQFRYGRLRLANAGGSQLVPLLLPMEAQYFTGAPTNAFVTNAADHCTTVPTASAGLGNFKGIAGGDTTASIAAGAFSAGRKSLTLSAPGASKSGSVDAVINLNAAAGAINPCVAFDPPAPTPTGAVLAHLRGDWCGTNFDRDPTARARFGVFRGADEVIFIREIY